MPGQRAVPLCLHRPEQAIREIRSLVRNHYSTRAANAASRDTAYYCGVALGMVPGQQRGGAYHGIATTPLTLANMSTWGREGVLALVTSGLGLDYQQPEGGGFGVQPEMGTGSPTELFVKGLADFGNLVWCNSGAVRYYL